MAYTQINPRFSVRSTTSLASASQSGRASPTLSVGPSANAARYSLPTPSIHTGAGTGLAPAKQPASGAGARPNIYDRPLNKTRTAEVSASAFAFLFSELVQYTQRRVSGVTDLERKLDTLGYRVGIRVLELQTWRSDGASKAPKREIRFLQALVSIQTQVWKAVFGKPADALQKSVEHEDEYMIVDDDPPITRNISVPRDMSTLSCSSFTAGIVEAVLDGLGFPARVTAHNTPAPGQPQRTTVLIKLEKSVLEREEVLK